jgi:hypothetical protein
MLRILGEIWVNSRREIRAKSLCLDSPRTDDEEASIPGPSSVSIPDLPSMSRSSTRISTPSRPGSVYVHVVPNVLTVQPTWEYSEERGRRVLLHSKDLVGLKP